MKYSRRAEDFWLGISLLIALYYGAQFYYFVFSHEYIVQDDARQHVVWLQRFIDRDLFPHDIIADYFYGLAPLGFKFFYLAAAKLGVEPILFAKILPPILAIITTVYLYLFTLQILPIPITGFINSLFINQLIWLNDDLVSATARAFIYPLFAAWLYYLSLNRIIPCLILMLLQGLFYPHILLIEMTIFSLRLLNYKSIFNIQLTKNKQAYVWWLAGLIITAIALYPVTQKPSELATTVTAMQMKQMPEFNLGGRSPFFDGRWLQQWLAGSSGLSLPLFPTIVWSGLFLPVLLKQELSVVKLINSKINILTQVTIASLIMFFLAHLLLPKLHLPSRYTYHTIRFVLATSSAIVITIWLKIGLIWLKQKQQFNLLDKAKISLITLFSLTVIIFPAIPHVFINWFQGWQIGTAPEIYQYITRQSKDILIASLSSKANNIPAFSQRSILVGDEFAMAYHPVYHDRIKQRTVDLLQAQYSSDLFKLQSFIKQYNVDYFLLDKDAFTAKYLLHKNRLINSSWSDDTKRAIAFLQSNQTPAIEKLIEPCTVVSTETLNLMEVSCILNK